MRILVTGATGLLGSHIAEKLSAAGRHVRTLVRPGSDASFLQSLGCEISRGDLADPSACAAAVAGIDIVFHCAAKVGDWGPWSEFEAACIDTTRTLASASLRANIRRFVHVSSTSAYGHPVDSGVPIDESAPLGRNLWIWDNYTRSKVESERLLWEMASAEQLPLTVIRPSWLYGERDRTTIARLVDRLGRGKVPWIGSGENPLSAVYAGNVADAAILAATDPGSINEAYNITDQGRITQRQFLDLFAQASGAPRVARSLPYTFVYGGAFVLEAYGRLIGSAKPPVITRYATWLMGRWLSYSTEKARTRLGWSPALGYRESIERSVCWYRDQQAADRPLSPSPSEPAVTLLR